MKPIISVEGLGKSYTIRHEGQTHYKSLREEIFKLPSRLLRRGGQSREEFWALKDVSFDIMPGDRVGIIGRNGAGKSTLLKLLSRITEPTTGRITLRGRVASLLEVGTGFHPELTGRENIYLNGAILGMSRAEVRRKFDEIVDFAGVEKFLDTPVKRYSSGMYVRLAFAVAAHLEPEILIVDEVLAVGDAEFQKKCLGKMEDVGREGRTVLFVSHNLSMIKFLCNSAMLLQDGVLRSSLSSTDETISSYINISEYKYCWLNHDISRYKENIIPIKISIIDKCGNIENSCIENNAIRYIEIEIEIIRPDPSLTVGYALYTEDGCLLYWSYQTDQREEMWPDMSRGRVLLRSQLPQKFLNEGRYRVELIAGLYCRKWLIEPGHGPSIDFEIRGGLSESPLWQMKRPGILAPLFSWTGSRL